MTTPEPVEATPAVIGAITDHLGPTVDISPEQINLVLSAWNNIRQGEPVGTVLRDPETGAIAHRIAEDGLHMWRVTTPDGQTRNDLNPTLPGWETMFAPTTPQE